MLLKLTFMNCNLCVNVWVFLIIRLVREGQLQKLGDGSDLDIS